MHDSVRRTDIVVLGAGISGMVLADGFARSGLSVALIDTYDRPGGNHISRQIDGFTFDIGSFMFFSHSPFFQLFPEARSMCLPAKFSTGRITPRGSVSAYPFSYRDDIADRGPGEVIQILGSALLGRIMGDNRTSAASFAIRHLGDRFFRESGLASYIERLCGAPAEQVEHVFATKRMAWIAHQAQAGALARRLTGKKSPPGPGITLARPRDGFPSLYAPVLQNLEGNGVQVSLGNNLTRITGSPGAFTLESSGGRFSCRRIISTAPLATTARLLGISPPAEVSSIDLGTLYLVTDANRGFSCNILYNFDRTGEWKRLTMHSDVYGLVDGKAYCSVEVPVLGAKFDPDLQAQMFRQHVQKYGLFKGDITLVGHELTRHAYPRYLRGATAAVSSMIAALERRGIEVAGRQGAHDYIPTASLATQLAIHRLKRERASSAEAIV